MPTIRFRAIEEVRYRKAIKVELPAVKTSEYFGVNVFDIDKMQEYLSQEAYESVKQAIDKSMKINRKIADQVASGMKAWAINRGATHYTHWFHPLTGATAEKHDAFFEPGKNGGVVENFGGDRLIQQEPDASSFPSGGIRNTFEARGYTAWDPTSPAFIIGKTLCIPTIFVAYTGEALDYKTPLIKSLNLLDKAAVDVCQYFDKNVTKVNAMLGWEQEYFLVDTALFNARPDLVLSGRTLMGHAAAKDQQLSDHYFASIPERVMEYMREFEVEAFKLGIPIKTRHNEVAPNQFECAPIHEEANLSVDHNQLLMDLMGKCARHHNFNVLFHEKPYDGINGSGKHNNWSLHTNNGKNLLAPGKTPTTNLQFLTFLVNTIKAVYDYGDLIRASISSAGNEHRLGAHEAPPAIMSVFIGEQMTKILEQIVTRVSNKKMTPDEKTDLKLNIGKIPEILLDNTDRNRTSPFAFTGNRFEFRTVGSATNCASPMIFLNVAVAACLNEFKKEVDNLIKDKIKKDEAIFQVLRKYIVESENVRFEGNGYSPEWISEAKRRGLTNISDAPTALKEFVSKKNIELLTKNNILSEKELQARYEIRLEQYVKKIQIEARILGDLAINHIVPTAIKYQNVLIENIRGLKELYSVKEFAKIAKTQLKTLKQISRHITSINSKVTDMIKARAKANSLKNIIKKADAYLIDVKPFLNDIRFHIDELELIVDDEMWTLPKYRELLFTC